MGGGGGRLGTIDTGCRGDKRSAARLSQIALAHSYAILLAL
jgi:hypothetical protein